jgi:universal stress protein A
MEPKRTTTATRAAAAESGQAANPMTAEPAQTSAGAGLTSPPSLRRILVPIDFSGASRQALKYAVPLAQEFGGVVHLVHVVEPIYLSGEVTPGYVGLDTSALAKTAQGHLEALAGEQLPPEVAGQTLVRTGVPYDEIGAVAKELEIDLIVLTTHGRTGLARALLGSTAERVVRHAPCPVLTVRLT